MAKGRVSYVKKELRRRKIERKRRIIQKLTNAIGMIVTVVTTEMLLAALLLL